MNAARRDKLIIKGVTLAAMLVYLLGMILLDRGCAIAQDAMPVPMIVYFDLGEAATGNTTAASGTSVFKVHSGSSLQTPPSSDVSSASGTSVIPVFSLQDGYFAFQLVTLTASQAQQGKGGSVDKMGVSPWYKTSIVDSASAWNAAKKNYIFPSSQGSGVSLAGNSLYQTQVYPGWTGYIQVGTDLAGNTAFDVIKAKGLLR